MRHSPSDGKDEAVSKPRGKCPDCGGPMKIVRIVPDRPGYEARSLKCVACDRETSEVFLLD
jgi:hypothetical protein